MNRRRMMVTVLAGGGATPNTPLATLLTNFDCGTRPVGFTQENQGGSSLQYLLHDIGDGYVIASRFSSVPTVNNDVPKLAIGYTVRRLLLDVDDDAVAVVKTGASWGSGLLSSGAWGGDYSRTVTAGDYAEWTTPAGSTLIHAWALSLAGNNGISLVTIDGDNTIANLLPTAQELVDSGVVANTILVANGGTLNPTDRCWDQYQTQGNKFGGKTLVDNLSSGIHTIRITLTAYKNSASSASRLYLSAIGSWGASVTLTTAGVDVLFVDNNLSQVDSIAEFAHAYKPSGGADEWIGHSGSDKLTSWVVSVDGVPIIPTDNVINAGQLVEVNVISYLRHTQSIPNIGTMELKYSMRPSGLVITYSLIWAVAGTVSTGYASMLPLSATFDKGSNIESVQDWTLSANDGSFVANEQSQAIYLWDADGLYGALCYLSDLSVVNNWLDCSTSFLEIEDRAGGVINKVYATRAQNKAVSPLDVWTSRTEYRIKRFSGGANASLARA